MDICVIGGSSKNLNILSDKIEGLSELDAHVKLKFKTFEQLTEDVKKKGISFLNTVDIIFALDVAFGQNKFSAERLKVFAAFQDALNAKRYQKKVYLLTKDADLYNMLRDEADEDDNFIYRNTVAYIYKDKLNVSLLKSVINGEQEKQGVKHSKFGERPSRTSQEVVDQTLERLQGSGGSEYIQDEKYYRNTSTISSIEQSEYADSKQRENELRKSAAQEKKEARISERNRRTKEKPTAGGSYDSPYHIVVNDEQISAYRIKITNDKGVLAVTGDSGSGISGVVANIAELYNNVDSKVAILDLDIYKRYQAVYFSDYEELQEKDSRGKGLVGLVDNYKSKRSSGINIKDNIDVYSISRYGRVDKDFEYRLFDRLPVILDKLKEEYDVVVIDLPISLLMQLSPDVTSRINASLFLTENLHYKIEDLLMLLIRTANTVNREAMTFFLRNSAIAFNRYIEGRVGFEEDEVCDGVFLTSLLDDLSSPYSEMNYTTHIPFDSHWENQISKDKRWVSEHTDNENTMTILLGKISFGE